MHQIVKHYIVKAGIEKVWALLTEPKLIDKWGGGPAEFNAVEGGKFSFWGGDIYGTNTKLVKPTQINQDWFGGKWSKPSKVVFLLNKSGNDTELTLYHDDLPLTEVKNFDAGWDDYYLTPLKELAESD